MSCLGVILLMHAIQPPLPSHTPARFDDAWRDHAPASGGRSLAKQKPTSASLPKSGLNKETGEAPPPRVSKEAKPKRAVVEHKYGAAAVGISRAAILLQILRETKFCSTKCSTNVWYVRSRVLPVVALSPRRSQRRMLVDGDATVQGPDGSTAHKRSTDKRFLSHSMDTEEIERELQRPTRASRSRERRRLRRDEENKQVTDWEV
jgi:hypothetical protein